MSVSGLQVGATGEGRGVQRGVEGAGEGEGRQAELGVEGSGKARGDGYGKVSGSRARNGAHNR